MELTKKILKEYEYYSTDTMAMYYGDCFEVMKFLPDCCIDIILTDPPYGLKFMGKQWDHGIPGILFWQEMLRLAKPGTMLMAFGGTRTYHRLACAIEDAGWEIRDCLMWLYGSGFPKSHDISKAIDKEAGVERGVVRTKRHDYPDSDTWGTAKNNNRGKGIWDNEGGGCVLSKIPVTAPATPEAQLWDGWGTALKPAYEPIILAMKPIEGTFANNAFKHGVAGLNIDDGRIEIETISAHGYEGQRNFGVGGKSSYSNKEESETTKPTYSAHQGRWPANVILDDEAAAALDEQSGVLTSGHFNGHRNKAKTKNSFGTFELEDECPTRGANSGGASRFFYTAKASKAERNRGVENLFWDRREKNPVRITEAEWKLLNVKERAIGNIHPTVKPLKLMKYLCTLLSTPTGGVVLDPFMGSGGTGVATNDSDFDMKFVGIDNDESSCEIAKGRLMYSEIKKVVTGAK
jgi:site-specific DNA-methyltransferase (adenine-specific)